MARTAITPLALARNLGEAKTQVNIDQSNGMVIANANPEKTVLRIANTGTLGNAIVRAASGGAAFGIPDAAWMRGQGDLTASVAATTGVSYFGPFDSARVLQSDGSMHIDFASGVAGTIEAVLLP